MGVKKELMDQLSPGNLLRAAVAAVILSVLLPFLSKIPAMGEGLVVGGGLIVSALLLVAGLALHAGRERLPGDLVMIALVLGVGQVVSQFLPVQAASLSLTGTAMILGLAAAYLSLGLGARAVEMVGLEL